MSFTITQTIHNTASTNVTRLILINQTLSLREQFRNQLENQINNSTINRLPYLNQIEMIQSMDSDTIIELNNTTTSERRINFMENIMNYRNSNENSTLETPKNISSKFNINIQNNIQIIQNQTNINNNKFFGETLGVSKEDLKKILLKFEE